MAWDNLISRLTWLLLQPSNLFLFLLLIAIFLLWKNRQKFGLFLIMTCAIFYMMVTFGPLVNWLLVPLEQRFSVYNNQISEAPYSGIIVLAGAERTRYSEKHQQVTLSGAAERLIAAVKLARIFPALPIIFCGGGKNGAMLSEADIARQFFSEAGIDVSRIRFDDKSYNTYSNALETKKHIQPHETGQWLLVTSAFHMPRTVGAYRMAGIPVQPYPVDYRSDLAYPLLRKPDAGRNFYQLDFAVHEWVGLLAYYISDRSTALFPAPKDLAQYVKRQT